MKRVVLLTLLLLVPQLSLGARAKLDTVSTDPYVSALAIEADSGKVLVSENADSQAYPASVLKLMDLLVILERIEQGRLRLDEMVQVTREAAQMGGSQVYLDSKEQFSVEDLLYALMVQSANDAAVALAIHISGSKDGFVALMNKRAQELGMKDSHFYSVHGLPPSVGQKVDVTTANDLALLARELAKKPEVFTYTGIREREFRDGKFIMRTHNHLLEEVSGCDGFKTGYFKAAGFSIVATAKRNGVRIISIVLGSKDRKVRDAKAKELITVGFSMVPAQPAEEPVAVVAPVTAVTEQPAEQTTEAEKEAIENIIPTTSELKIFLYGVGTGIVLFGLLSFFISRRGRRGRSRYLR